MWNARGCGTQASAMSKPKLGPPLSAYPTFRHSPPGSYASTALIAALIVGRASSSDPDGSTRTPWLDLWRPQTVVAMASGR